jgi:hypothetical protein
MVVVVLAAAAAVEAAAMTAASLVAGLAARLPAVVAVDRWAPAAGLRRAVAAAVEASSRPVGSSAAALSVAA